ncbi:hypothetical protein [Paucidesulfovibrio longus]|uniref:hypothetical protein n=1 Tax=Paucidesulfovibrio longus TaxID=889 RepID=UPI0004085152|nr:hypothetical protein [Paucidesulfovibrio longus]
MRTILFKHAQSLILILAFAGAAFAVQGAEPSQSVISQGGVWEHPLAPGEYAYCIDYLDGDMFVTVKTQFLGPEGNVLAEATHTLVREQRMSVRKQFRTEKVSDLAEPQRIRFACDSGRVRVSLLPADSEKLL